MRGRLTLSWQRVINSLVCVLVLAGARSNVNAQTVPSASKAVESKPTEGNGTKKKEAASNSGKPPSDSVLPPATIRYLPNKDNELIPIPNDVSFESYIKYIEEERNKPVGPQTYTITEIDIDGVANDERATLTATFTVRLQESDRFERVPLFFNDAVLIQRVSYIGGGEEYSDKKDPKQGHVWWFKGKGPHQLKLVFSVPLQKPLPSRHLIVPLPISAISHIKMTLPFPSVKPTIFPEQTVVEVKPAGDGKTSIDVRGLGSHLDLSWQPNIDIGPNDVLLESLTTIFAQIESDQVSLRVNQKINSLYGQFDHISETLPTAAELIALDGPEKPSYKFDSDNRQRVTVTFKEKAASAQLNWILRIPAKLKTPLTIDGFVIDDARKHVGWIGLSIAEGLQFSERRNPAFLTMNQTLASVPVGEFPSAMGSARLAYKFISQPFKLVTVFDEVKPYFEVKPRLVLHASAQQLILDGTFDFRVDRYSMNSVALTWPNFKSEGWTIDSVEEPRVVESYEIDEKGQVTEIHARLVKHFTGPFSVHLRAHRQFKSGDEVTFSMPRPKTASRLSPSILLLVNAENVESDLTARGETVFHQLPSTALDSNPLPEFAKTLKATPYQVDTDEQSFGLRVTPQKQRIRTESFVEAEWQENQFRMIQHLHYTVDYERLNQVRLVVPSAIDLDRCRFVGVFGEKNVELQPESLPASGGSGRQIQLKLSESHLGKFEIQVTYSIPFPKHPTFDSETHVELPFLENVDEPFSQTEVSLVQSDWFDAEPVSTEVWRLQRNRLDAWEWMAEGSPSNLTLKLVRSTHGNETGNVSRAFVKITLDETGDGIVRAQFRVSKRATLLPVQLPSNAKSASFFWDAKPLSKRECVETPVGSHRFVIEPEGSEESLSQEHLLTITYQEKFSSTMGWTERLDLRSPILSNCSWKEVIWQVVLPAGQHLLTYPTSAATLFRWQRTGLVWSRVSDRDTDWLQKWITENTVGSPELDEILSEKNGNSYLFRQLDLPRSVVFQTLTSSMILLFGMGFSLVVGFIMLRVVALCHVLTLLFLGLIVAIAGLWYAAPLELLLQPMIAGMFFPVVAVLLEGWVRKRYENGSLSFDGKGEFPPLHAFGSHYGIRQTDPNESTVHRPAFRESESGVHVESGSGVS